MGIVLNVVQMILTDIMKFRNLCAQLHRQLKNSLVGVRKAAGFMHLKKYWENSKAAVENLKKAKEVLRPVSFRGCWILTHCETVRPD